MKSNKVLFGSIVLVLMAIVLAGCDKVSDWLTTAWKDPVWSQVIAHIINTVITGIGGWLLGWFACKKREAKREAKRVKYVLRAPFGKIVNYGGTINIHGATIGSGNTVQSGGSGNTIGNVNTYQPNKVVNVESDKKNDKNESYLSNVDVDSLWEHDLKNWLRDAQGILDPTREEIEKWDVRLQSSSPDAQKDIDSFSKYTGWKIRKELNVKGTWKDSKSGSTIKITDNNITLSGSYWKSIGVLPGTYMYHNDGKIVTDVIKLSGRPLEFVSTSIGGNSDDLLVNEELPRFFKRMH